MSYILEALKKAQAERQLGSTPTIHASQLHLSDAAGARPSRLPLAASLAVAVLAVGAAVAFYMQPVAAPVAPAVPARPAPVTQAATPVPGAGVAAAAAAPLAVTPSRVAAAPPVPAAAVTRAAPPAPAVATTARVAAVPARAPALAMATPAAPVAAAADPLPLQRELPGGGAGIPKVELGGYIYSDNPADRLIVIDRELRKEGDEVAPGLVLEQLGPGAAVMNYRGTRFRIPY